MGLESFPGWIPKLPSRGSRPSHYRKDLQDDNHHRAYQRIIHHHQSPSLGYRHSTCIHDRVLSPGYPRAMARKETPCSLRSLTWIQGRNFSALQSAPNTVASHGPAPFGGYAHYPSPANHLLIRISQTLLQDTQNSSGHNKTPATKHP